MVSVFVDTGGWFASVVPTDPEHRRVVDWLKENSQPLITTDYVVDETLTLLRARGEGTRAITLGRGFFDLRLTNVFYLAHKHIERAWRQFHEQPQRRWSFTDCTSRVVIEELHIRRALTLDRHFAEFGPIELVP